MSVVLGLGGSEIEHDHAHERKHRMIRRLTVVIIALAAVCEGARDASSQAARPAPGTAVSRHAGAGVARLRFFAALV